MILYQEKQNIPLLTQICKQKTNNKQDQIRKHHTIVGHQTQKTDMILNLYLPTSALANKNLALLKIELQSILQLIYLVHRIVLDKNLV